MRAAAAGRCPRDRLAGGLTWARPTTPGGVVPRRSGRRGGAAGAPTPATLAGASPRAAFSSSAPSALPLGQRSSSAVFALPQTAARSALGGVAASVRSLSTATTAPAVPASAALLLDVLARFKAIASDVSLTPDAAAVAVLGELAAALEAAAALPAAHAARLRAQALERAVSDLMARGHSRTGIALLQAAWRQPTLRLPWLAVPEGLPERVAAALTGGGGFAPDAPLLAATLRRLAAVLAKESSAAGSAAAAPVPPSTLSHADAAGESGFLATWMLRERAADAGAAAGTLTLRDAASLVSALAELWCVTGLPPRAVTDRLGYRPGTAAAAGAGGAAAGGSVDGAAAAAAGEAASSSSSFTVAGMPLTTASRLPRSVGEIVAATAEADAAAAADGGGEAAAAAAAAVWRRIEAGKGSGGKAAGSTKAAKAASTGSDAPCPATDAAFLWQARGGAWVSARMRLPKVAAAAGRCGVTATASRTVPASAVLDTQDVTLVAAGASGSGTGSAAGWLKRVATAVADAAAGPAAAAAVTLGPRDGAHLAVDAPPLGVSSRSPASRVLAGLWREATGHYITPHAVVATYSPAVLRGEAAALHALLPHLTRLVANADDLAWLAALVAADTGRSISGAALTTAVEQAVRFGDIALAHALLQDAAAAGGDADSGATASSSARSAAVADGYNALVRGLSSQGAHVQALTAYDTALGLGVLPTAPTVAAVLTSLAELPLPEDAVRIGRGLVAAALAPATACSETSWIGGLRSTRRAAKVAAGEASKTPASAPAAAPSLPPLPGWLRLRGGAAAPATLPPSTPWARVADLQAATAAYASAAAAAAPAGTSAPGLSLPVPPSLLAAAVAALGRAGDVDGVHAAFAAVRGALAASSAGTPPPRLPAVLGRAFVRAYACAGDLPAAAAAARFSLVAGAALSERSLLSLARNAIRRSDLGPVFEALALMEAAGISAGPATEAALVGAAAVIARSDGLPVPDAALAAAEARARGAGAAAAAAAAAATAPTTRDALVPASAAALAPADAAAAARAAALTASLSATLSRFSSLAAPALRAEVLATLRGDAFPPAAAAASSSTHPLAGAVEAASSLCTAIARWVASHLAAAAAARQGSSAASSAALAAASNPFSSNSQLPDVEEPEQTPLDAARELLGLAIAEWPVSQALAAAAPELNAAEVPAAASARLAATFPGYMAGAASAPVLARAAAASAAAPAPWSSFGTILASSPSYAAFRAGVEAPQAPFDLATEAGVVALTQHRGRLQRLPAGFGGLKHTSRLNPDEDGSGTLGPRPLVRLQAGAAVVSAQRSVAAPAPAATASGTATAAEAGSVEAAVDAALDSSAAAKGGARRGAAGSGLLASPRALAEARATAARAPALVSWLTGRQGGGNSSGGKAAAAVPSTPPAPSPPSTVAARAVDWSGIKALLAGQGGAGKR